ncbi:PREDICTED: trem-like transcript 4 protein [Galeopterus variegatus]|uniref:Trem-like transcript 4 protein n=1 Tax=Galeopterus variegatus TaxID=482537 RepID=A0ABM0QTH2_GALVR|nr:PREDICTED: trem-like transcript 4 protein [Galeopterus variegatus]
MAGEVTYLLLPVLLVLLASGSWAQMAELLHKLEGETISVRCPYQCYQASRRKVWCRQTSVDRCFTLVDSSRPRAWGSRYFIQDDRNSCHFTVTMTELTVKDSGFYWCGIHESYRIILGIIHLMVSQGTVNDIPTPSSQPSISSHSLLTVPNAPNNYTATDAQLSGEGMSPPSHWKFIIPGVVVAALLLLALALLMALYLRKARGRAGKGEDGSHHVYDDIAAQKEPTLSAPKRATDHCSRDLYNGHLVFFDSQGFSQPMVSDEDTEAICYASLIHLNQFSHEDSIYANTNPNLKPTPDPLLSVEYASITGNGPRPSKSAAPEGEPRN